MNQARAQTLAWVLVASPILVMGVMTSDARMRRSLRRAEEPAIAAVAARLPMHDLALSGGARWLRAASVEEPGAAFADGPAMPDPDPAGGAVAPPVEVWAEVEERARAARRRN
jgi:hypothetical protein